MAAGAAPPPERRLPDAVPGPQPDGAGPRLGHQREGGRAVSPGSESPEPSGEDARAPAPLDRSEPGRANCVDPPALLFQGSSWLHVGTDQPFKSISIGGARQVWAIARDGAVFYRGSVSQQNPAGRNAELGLVYHHCTFVHLYSRLLFTPPPHRRMLVPHPAPPPTDAPTALGGPDFCLRCG